MGRQFSEQANRISKIKKLKFTFNKDAIMPTYLL